MRITLVISMLWVTQVFALPAWSQSTRLSLNHVNTTIRKVLQDIEEKTDYYFMYNGQFVNVERTVSIQISDKNITDVLDVLFANTGIKYKIEDRQIALTENLINRAQTQQPLTVKGTVKGSDDSPVPGATIVIKRSGTGTITDENGNFILTNVPADAVLVVSFVGMRTTEIEVANQQNITIILENETIGLEEVVAIGYGVQKKKLTTGATIQVSGEDMQKLSTVSALGALQSQTPGVTIIQSSGMPGEGHKVTVRGLGTVGSSSPLYVIDGVAGSNINLLNPADIESVDVLKDAASAAIYGARAANGVILVTTKQGRTGKMQITYDGYYGIQNPYKVPPLLNAREYMTILNEVNFNEGLAPYDWSAMMPELYERIQDGWAGTNWLDEIRNKNAVMQNHAFNLTGGNEISKFSMGFSYTDQQGIYGSPVEPDFKRYTARINSEHLVYKNSKGLEVIKIGENLNYNYNEKKGIGIGNIYWNDIHNVLVATPLMPVYNDNGEYWAKTDNTSSGLASLDPSLTNPVASMVYQRGQNMSKNYALNANIYVEIQPIRDLIFRSNFGYKMSANSYRQYTPKYELSETTVNTIDRVNQSMGSGYSWTWENTFTYSFSLASHTFNALIGQSLEKWGMGESMNATNGYSLFRDFKHAWLDNTQGLTSGITSLSGSPWGEGAISSFFGRLNYNYKETYMASVIMRADGSANFAKGNRWGYFPSASLGWVITNESFMAGTTEWMNFLKLRGSWGQNGNADIANFQYLATVAFDGRNKYSFGNTKESQSTGGYPDILPNTNITWETSEQLDLGFDARFIDSRMGLAFDWYKKTTKDWLVLAPTLASYGTGAPYINGGDVENTGIEIGLNWNDQAGDFTYTINLNAATNKNKVTRIANGEGIIHGEPNVLSQGTVEMYRAEVGKPIGYFWGYKTAGVFQNVEQIANTPAKLQSNPQPGDLIFVDTSHDGKITVDDKTEIGNPHPDVTVGFSLNMGYKGFDFSVTANGAFGHQIAKSYRSFADSKVQNYTTDIFGRWHGEGTSNKLPRLTSGSNTNWQEISDIYIEDADFLKIQNVTLGYDFKKILTRLPFSQARLYLTAQNLYTFTGYSGMDPEIGYGYDESWVSGIDLGFYPSPRTYIIGVNLKF